jgi:predicted Kef-type K+ transport protein
MDIWSILSFASIFAGAIGLTLFGIGSIVSVITALGNKHWAWGVAILLFAPVAFLYCYIHSDVTDWPRSLLMKSLISFGLALVFALPFIFHSTTIVSAPTA